MFEPGSVITTPKSLTIVNYINIRLGIMDVVFTSEEKRRNVN